MSAQYQAEVSRVTDMDRIYRELCKPSPLSKPPKLLTLDEFHELVQQAKVDPRNYKGADWSEVG